MHANASFDYAVVRVVPRVEREEFVNAGVILYCPERRFLACRVELDLHRLQTLAPDVDLSAVERHLSAFVGVCSGSTDGGAMAKLSQRERFHWLTAPRSTMLQTSAVRTGVCPPPVDEMDREACSDLKGMLGSILRSVVDVIPPDHRNVTASCGGRR